MLHHFSLLLCLAVAGWAAASPRYIKDAAAAAAETPVPVYDELLAKDLLHFAAAAYGDNDNVEDCITSAFDDDSSVVVYGSGKQACDWLGHQCSFLIAHSLKRNASIIAFRGTSSTMQLLLEGVHTVKSKAHNYFYTTEETAEEKRLHSYFEEAQKKTWPMVEEYLRLPEYKDHFISFTGHSLGGAIAALTSLKTVQSGLRASNMLRLYTFGEPRVGNANVAKEIDLLVPESYRIVNGNDAIPHFPRCTLVNGACSESGFYHHGTEIWYPRGGSTYRTCTGWPKNEDRTCSNSVSDSWFTNPASYTSDHLGVFNVTQISAFGKSGCKSLSEEEANQINEENNELIEEQAERNFDI